MKIKSATMFSKPKNCQKYRPEYTQLWSCLSASNVSLQHAFCELCKCDFSVQHGGKDDCRRHVNSKKHQEFSKLKVSSKPVTSFFKSDAVDPTTNAEVLFTSFLVEHNIPLAVADHVGPLLKAMCPDSKIIANYACKRTKTTAIVQTLAESSQEEIVKNAVSSAFSIATDGSHNAGEETLYPVVVTAYRSDLGKIVSEVLSVPVCSMSNTGENIFKLLNEELCKKGLSWNNCICFAADNCSTMTGQYKGTAAFISKENPNVFIQGCACHLIHIAAQKAAKELPVSIEDLLIDLYYYLDKSALRHQKLKQCQVLCDTATHKILKHTSTRWLSLKNCVDRLLEQWPVLQNFFLGDTALSNNSNIDLPRELAVSVPSSIMAENCVLKFISTPLNSNVPALSSGPKSSSKLFSVRSGQSEKGHKSNTATCLKTSELTKLHSQKGAVSYKSKSSSSHSSVSSKNKNNSGIDQPSKRKKTSNSKFPSTNSRFERIKLALSSPVTKLYCLFLQSTVPVFTKINILLQSETPHIHVLRSELLSLLSELFVRFIRPEAIRNAESVLTVDYRNRKSQKESSSLVIGSKTRSLLTDASVGLTEADVATFYTSVRKYFESACKYIVDKFPLNSEVLIHAAVADINQRDKVSFDSVDFFCKKFNTLLSEEETSALELEFAKYQAEDFSQEILTCDRMDVAWHLIKNLRYADGGLRFCSLPKVMLAILCIPHSNAFCERIFSIVRKNKTEFRPTLGSKLLESLIVQKVHMMVSGTVCYEQKFSKELLAKAKKSTQNMLK